MAKSKIARSIVLTSTVAILVGILPVPIAYSQDQDVPILDYDPSPDAIVLQVSRSRARDFSGPPNLRIYGDGRVLIYRPLKPAEERYRQHYLTQKEMSDLLLFLYEHNAMEYPYGIVEQRGKEKALATQRRGSDGRITVNFYGAIDSAFSKLELSLRRFGPRGTEDSITDFHHETGGHAIGPFAKSMPDVKEAQDMYQVFVRLIELERDLDRAPAQPPRDDADDDATGTPKLNPAYAWHTFMSPIVRATTPAASNAP